MWKERKNSGYQWQRRENFPTHWQVFLYRQTTKNMIWIERARDFNGVDTLIKLVTAELTMVTV